MNVNKGKFKLKQEKINLAFQIKQIQENREFLQKESEKL